MQPEIFQIPRLYFVNFLFEISLEQLIFRQNISGTVLPNKSFHLVKVLTDFDCHDSMFPAKFLIFPPYILKGTNATEFTFIILQCYMS